LEGGRQPVTDTVHLLERPLSWEAGAAFSLGVLQLQ